MNAKYNRQSFAAWVDGKEYRFKAYTTDTRNGFCHTVVSLDYGITDTKVSYINRTWERFDYESALKKTISKFPEGMRESLHAQLIERKSAEEHDKAEAMVSNFKSLYDGLNEENKKRMAGLPLMQSEDDMRAYMGFMGLLTLMQK